MMNKENITNRLKNFKKEVDFMVIITENIIKKVEGET